MSRPISKSIFKVAEKTGSNRIVLFTNHLKVDGNLYRKDGKCEECHEDILSLTDVLVCRLNDYCTCDDEDCECNDYVCFRYDWLNINVDSVVAYSILTEEE